MFAAGHEAEGGVEAVGGERAVQKRTQLAGGDQRGDFRHELAREGGVAGKDGVHGHHVEGRVFAQVPHGQLRVLVDVAFADLDEASEFREAGEAHGDGFGRERVEHGVDAATSGQALHFLGEIAAARIDDMRDAQCFEQGALGRASGRSDHLGPEVMGNLDRGHADPARSGVHEDGFVGADARHVDQRMPCGHENDRDSRGLLGSDSRGNRQHILRARQGVGGEAEDSEAENAITRLHMGHTVSNRDDFTSHFVAIHARIDGFRRIKSERFENVAEIEACGFDPDENLARFTSGHGERCECQTVEHAALARFHAQRHFGAEFAVAGRQAAGDALPVTGFVAQGDFALGFLARKFAQQNGGIAGRGGGRQVNVADNKMRVLVEKDAKNTQNRPRGVIDRSAMAPDRLRATGDHVDTDPAGARAEASEENGKTPQSSDVPEHVAVARCVQTPQINQTTRNA